MIANDSLGAGKSQWIDRAQAAERSGPMPNLGSRHRLPWPAVVDVPAGTDTFSAVESLAHGNLFDWLHCAAATFDFCDDSTVEIAVRNSMDTAGKPGRVTVNLALWPRPLALRDRPLCVDFHRHLIGSSSSLVVIELVEQRRVLDAAFGLELRFIDGMRRLVFDAPPRQGPFG